MRRALLALYPRAWRERYGPEIEALLDESGLGVRAAADLLRGAADAHLRPGDLELPPPERMRGSVIVATCCGTAFALVGAGFAKSTEDGPAATAAHAHALLGTARSSIEVFAALAVTVVVLGGATIVRASPRVLRAPLLAAGAFLAGTASLLVSGAHAGTGLLLWSCLAALTCVYGARGARFELQRSPLTPTALRRGAIGAAALALCMAAICALLALYATALAYESASAAASSSGPLGTSVEAASLLSLLLMTTLTALSALSATRGLRAARHPCPGRGSPS